MMAMHVWAGGTCVTLDGSKFMIAHPFRPIVSIDLTSSKCTMTSSVDETGEMKITLNFGDA